MFLSRTHAMSKVSVESKIITSTLGLEAMLPWMHLYQSRTLKDIKKALAPADNTIYAKPKWYI